jgi:hypothetical protein
VCAEIDGKRLIGRKIRSFEIDVTYTVRGLRSCLSVISDLVLYAASRCQPDMARSWRIRAHAAIGVWYNPRQCGCQQYDLRLVPQESGVLIATVAATVQTRGVSTPARRPASSQSAFQLRSLSTSKAEISKLDWLFLNARIDVLMNLGTQNPIPTFTYDQTQDRVVATAWASPEWFKSTSVQKIKDTADEYCAQVFITEHAMESRLTKDANLDDRLKEYTEISHHCYVQLFSVTTEGKPIVVIQNGEVALK